MFLLKKNTTLRSLVDFYGLSQFFVDVVGVVELCVGVV